MEPISISLILAGLAGVASKKIIDETWSHGKKWLDNYFRDHKDNVKVAAEQNSLAFLNDLALRMQTIENSIKDSEKAREVLEEKFNDPDFAATLQSAMIVAARTPSEYKHKILSRTIAERLQSKKQSLVELSSSMAVDALQYLGENHLNALGIISVVLHIRPEKKDVNMNAHTTFPQWYSAWLTDRLSWAPADFEISFIHYMHLMSTSCLDYGFIGSKDLKKMLTPKISYQQNDPWDPDIFLDKALGKKVRKWWEAGMTRVNLTTSGMLIGAYVVDHKIGSNTRIEWE